MMGLDGHDGFTGAHPTTAEFTGLLRAWGFTQRRDQGVHLVFRGPHGGTVRVLRSLLGRADPDLAAKAARLAGVSTEDFWAGPAAALPVAADPVLTTAASCPEPAEPPAAAPAAAETRRRQARPARDRNISLVLAAHTLADRPLGFDQVADLCHRQITREQARSASAQLCRDGDLDRIRPGVYQWSGGTRATPVPGAAVLHTIRHDHPAPAPPQPVTAQPAPGQQPAAAAASAAELFSQLFPTGVLMTAELLADFERWAQLTNKIAQTPRAS